MNEQQKNDQQQQNDQQSATREKPGANQGVNYQTPKKVRDKAMNPTPASNATQQSTKSSIGKGKTTVNTSKDNSFWGRPAYIAQLKDGSLLISDEQLGAIYRISYSAPKK